MSIRTARFNGSTSKIDCGDYHPLTGDITVLAWISPRSVGEGKGRIIDNGKFLIQMESVNHISASSNGSTIEYGGTELPLVNHNRFITVTRKADGTMQFYVDGEVSNVEQTSDTPEAGTTDIIIGNRNASDRTFDGDIPEVKIIEGLLTPSEISQYYTATKHLYNK